MEARGIYLHVWDMGGHFLWPLRCKYGCRKRCGLWKENKNHKFMKGGKEAWRKHVGLIRRIGR